MLIEYLKNELHIDKVSLMQIAEAVGTPCYVYSQTSFLNKLRELQLALSKIRHPYKIFYAVKANHNLSILNQFYRHHTGFDIVSIGEFKRVIAAGGSPCDIIFSGIGKREDELQVAILENIHCLNVESAQELQTISRIASHYQKPTNIAIRINPDVTADTHAHITTGGREHKFGILAANLHELLPILNNPLLQFQGIACHIGSQITELKPFAKAGAHMLECYHLLREHGFLCKHISMGGGFGIAYDSETELPSTQSYVDTIAKPFLDLPITLYIEPGRFLMGNAGCLLTKVLYTKLQGGHAFAVLDAGMNDLMRPALYEANHRIVPIQKPDENAQKIAWQIVGPVCETTDSFQNACNLALQSGDHLAILDAGAYGSSMSSQYNSRPLIPEVMLANQTSYLIRSRQPLAAIYQDEHIVDI